MEFRVLGPLEVLDQGAALPLGGSRQRAVLAYLILEANRVVSTDQLIDRIWGDEAPEAARPALFAYVSRLRKLLGAGRIQARPPGYVLVAEQGEVDALRFAALVDEARRQAADWEAAAALLTEALALWRGSALSDLADYDALRPAIARLEELRLGASEDRIEAEIALGRHREVIAQLERLTGDYPLRERMWSQLILALYRSGRQGDALGAYHRARTTLVEELGIDPSPELRHLHEQVLLQDPALDLPVRPASADGQSGKPDLARDEPQAAPRRPGRRYAIGGLALGLVAVSLVWLMVQAPKGLPASAWTIGLDMPLSGPIADRGPPVRNAVQLAIEEIRASGGVAGSTLGVVVQDDASDPDTAAAIARAFVADAKTIAMIGPWDSRATFPVIPITNQAGLLECSPSSTHPGLTKPRDGALDLRSAHPNAINYVRLAPADDIQAFALASFAHDDLSARYALVIDDAGTGRVIADPFEEDFKRLGGATIRVALNPGEDPHAVLAPLSDAANAPDLVFFGGTPDGAVAVRRTMTEGGDASIPLLSWDPLLDGDGGVSGSYIQRVGVEAAIGTYVAHASLPDHKSSFADAYRRRFGSEPDEYAAAGYACVQIIADAMRGVAPRGPAADQVRGSVRGYAVDPAHRYETVLGTVGFDANGDALQQFVTFYRVESSAATGAGDWVVFKKQDFGPAP